MILKGSKTAAIPNANAKTPLRISFHHVRERVHQAGTEQVYLAIDCYQRYEREQTCRKIRGIVGVAVALAAVFWPGMTSFVAVERIGLWAVLIGVVELVFAAILQRTDGPNWAFVRSLVNSARERNFLS